MAELVVIVSSFNRLDLLREAFASLLAAGKACPSSVAVVVYDAGSTDGSREWIETQATKEETIPISLLRPVAGDETSFGAGINAACALALQQYPSLKWLLFFETDNWIAGPEPLRAAIALLEQEPHLAAAGFTVRRHDGRAAGYGCPFPTATQFLLGPQVTHKLRWDRPRVHHPRWCGNSRWWLCDVVYTSPLLIKREAWEQSAGFDAATFPFADSDLDWAWRLHTSGWRQAVIETNDVVHDNREQRSVWSTARTLNFHRARLALLRRHRGAVMATLKPLLWLRHGLEALAILSVWGRLRDPRASLYTRLTMLRSVFSGYETVPPRA